MERSGLARIDLPDAPGVYLFRRGRKVLYVGKATSLRDRVRSYFDDAVIATRGPRIVDMITKADRVAHETTPTVLEALVREAALIKKYHPPANAKEKDDSTFLYAVITREDIPRVLAVRGKDIDFARRRTRSNLKSESSRFDLVLRAIYGPFPSSAQLREGLRLIRRIFPFFDTQKPLDFARGKPVGRGKHESARIEFNKQIGQYPKEFDKADYRKTIRKVAVFLSGRGKELRRMIEKEMKRAAEEERFEDAERARRELFALDHIQDVSLIKDDEAAPRSARGQFAPAGRIEAYDVAHLGGTNAIGVMAVLRDGEPSKRDYRTFRIRGFKDVVRPVGRTTSKQKQNDDIASLKEILSRRLGHQEWPLPSVIVVDGGKAHKKAAEHALAEAGFNIIPVAAVVKDERHRPREVLPAGRQASVYSIPIHDIILANAEAHRFSLSRHRKARSRALRTQ